MKHPIFSYYFSALAVISLALFSSCGSKRNVVYFQNSDKIPRFMLEREKAESNILIKPNDNLFIAVTAAVNPEAVEVFNMNRTRTTLSAATLDVYGYLVDQRGNINLPLIGEVHVAGLSKWEVVRLLQKKISEFITEPVVINIRFLNFKVSVLGEVNRPGVYTVADEMLSIPQALALAGDLTIYGNRRNVQLIRIENGEKIFYDIDLTTPDIFFSSNYYLLQDDILYVAPNKTKAGSSTYNQNLPLLVSVLSLTVTSVALFLSYK